MTEEKRMHGCGDSIDGKPFIQFVNAVPPHIKDAGWYIIRPGLITRVFFCPICGKKLEA